MIPKKIVLLQHLEENSGLREPVKALLDGLTRAGHKVDRFILQDLKIQHCTGCWSCWLKTPGLCANHDATDTIRRAWSQADLVIYACTLSMGFLPSEAKAVTDRFIPLVHPYFALVGCELMHLHRYARLPALACLLEPGPGDNDEDLEVTIQWMRRTAEHMREPLLFAAGAHHSMDALVEQVSHWDRGPAGNSARERPPRPARKPIPDVPPRTPPHRLLLLNGSPRGKQSNTRLVLEQVQKGFEQVQKGFEQVHGNQTELHYLVNRSARARARAAWEQADLVILAFPLYVHAMPGIVKAFAESLAKSQPRPGRRIGFIVQSGFPEARQSRWLEPWLVRLARRLEAEYLGFVVKGAVEGIQVQPPWMTRNLFARFEALGRVLGETGTLDPGLIDQLAQPETLSRARRTVYGALIRTRLADWYWNDQLRKNGAFERRFARPYDPPGRAGPWHSRAQDRWTKWPPNPTRSEPRIDA